MGIVSLKNRVSTGRVTILLTIGVALVSSALLFNVSAQDEQESVANNPDSRDMLAYVSEDSHLILYNPQDRTETTLLDNVRSFVLGRDGRIAFTKQDESDHELYVFDSSTSALAPINISQNPAVDNYPLAWSPDGHYLAFGSHQAEGEHSLYVWDGNTTTDVMPDNGLDTADAFYVNWSYDGRLAFTIQHGWSNLDIPSEIYIWDGNITTNLSQNPVGWDGASMWSIAGQLMFASTWDEETAIYVWDGISFDDGVPDKDSFMRLAPELQPVDAIWTNDGLIGFTSYSDSGTKEIILWDLEEEAIIRRIGVSSENAWSWLAEDGQVILSSHLASGIPSYYLDVENTNGEILFSTHTGEFSWSSDGYLAYCGIDEGRSELLSIWNGEETWVVAKVSYKPVQWQYGQNTFSCNNG